MDKGRGQGNDAGLSAGQVSLALGQAEEPPPSFQPHYRPAERGQGKLFYLGPPPGGKDRRYRSTQGSVRRSCPFYCAIQFTKMCLR